MVGKRVDSVTKQFGTNVVLEGSSVEIRPGATGGSVSTNGADKAPLSHLSAGALAESKEEVDEDERTLADLDEDWHDCAQHQ